MNTYRVSVQTASMNRPRHFDVDASSARVAINRAMYGLMSGDVVTVGCRTVAESISRHYSDPKVRAA